MNAILLAIGVIALVLVLAHLLERFAKPANPEAMGRMSLILMVLVFIALVTQFIYMAVSG